MYPAFEQGQHNTESIEVPQHDRKCDNDTTCDESIARNLQAEYDREVSHPVVALPDASQGMPYNCGNCNTTHVVCNVTHNSLFQCTRCGCKNRIMLHPQQPVVVVERGSIIPIPLFCAIM